MKGEGMLKELVSRLKAKAFRLFTPHRESVPRKPPKPSAGTQVRTYTRMMILYPGTSDGSQERKLEPFDHYSTTLPIILLGPSLTENPKQQFLLVTKDSCEPSSQVTQLWDILSIH